MDATMISAMLRRAASISRRRAFQAMSGVALSGALALPTATRAGKKGKKSRQQCKRQEGACLTAIVKVCESTIDPSACEASLNPCCASFATCNAGMGIECLFKVA